MLIKKRGKFECTNKNKQIFRSVEEKSECPFYFSDKQKPCKKGPCKKECKKGPSTVDILYLRDDKLSNYTFSFFIDFFARQFLSATHKLCVARNFFKILPTRFANRKFEKVKIMAFFRFSRIGPRVSNVVNRNSETRVELFCVREAGNLARMIHSE